MNRVLRRLALNSPAAWAGVALAVCGLTEVLAQPIPVPAPRFHLTLPAQHASQEAQTGLPVVIGLTLGTAAKGARVTLELSDPLDVRVFTLTSPNRVVIDMPEVLWRLTKEPRPSGRGAVKSYRYGLFRKGNSRFVVELNTPVEIGKPQMLSPEGGSGFRLAIDLTPTAPAEFLAHAGWPKDIPATASAAPVILPPAPGNGGKRVIIVDAGHGGIDPGTHGQSGLQEKDVVLAVAKELRRTLESTGRYRVQLTRQTDVFIPLRERVAIARVAHGDLFVSLHADSNDHREIRGASVYTLSEAASDREAATLAEKENMSDVIAGVDLSGENNPVASILIDLAQRDTMNRSMRFAETVVGALPAATTLLPVLPHRSAGFAVLKAPDVPAVLIELGYLTNAKDEAAMATAAWRKGVAQAISGAIDAHFGAEAGAPARQAANP